MLEMSEGSTDMSKYTTGDPYFLNPDKVEFNNEFTDFNPLHSEKEYEGTKTSIIQQGQLKPIYMLQGLCVDGRHRTRICQELGNEVQAINLKKDIDKATIFDLCNVETMAGRNLTPTQRAINALIYKETLGVKQSDAAIKFQVTRQAVVYANKLKNTYKYQEAVGNLLKGGSVQLANMDKPSKSLEFLCKKAKELEEMNTVVVDTSERIQFDPDSAIKTEVGKAWYYDKMNRLGIDNTNVELRMDYVQLANYLYRESNETKN